MKKDRRATHVKSRTGGRPLTGDRGKGTPTSRPTTADLLSSPVLEVPPPSAHKAKRMSTPEEYARNAISRDLILPVQLRMLVSFDSMEAFLHPPKKKPLFKTPDAKPRRLGGSGKSKFGRA